MDSTIRVSKARFKLEQNKNLSDSTFFATRGHAQYYAEPESTDDLIRCLEEAYRLGLKVSVIGDGTHVIISDEGIDGLLVSTRRLTGMTIKGNLITAYSGESLSDVINVGIDHNLSGLEELGGIPGTVAAALKVNASSQGKSISDYHFYSDCVTMDGRIHRRPDYKDLFGYQKSFIGSDEIVLSVTLKLEPTKRTAEARMKKERFVELKFVPPACNFVGEVFRDPDGMSAREVIKNAGLAGYQGFRAEFSPFQSNCIFAFPGCTASELVQMISFVRSRVLERTGILLEPQVSFLGKFDRD